MVRNDNKCFGCHEGIFYYFPVNTIFGGTLKIDRIIYPSSHVSQQRS